MGAKDAALQADSAGLERNISNYFRGMAQGVSKLGCEIGLVSSTAKTYTTHT
jgi:hypothetical protein